MDEGPVGNIVSYRAVGSGAAWRRSPHQKSAGRQREKEEKGGKKEKREEKKKERERRASHVQNRVFLCSLDNSLQKNVIVFFFGNQISKWCSFVKIKGYF